MDKVLGLHSIGDSGHGDESVVAFTEALGGRYHTIVNGDPKRVQKLLGTGVELIVRRKLTDWSDDDADNKQPGEQWAEYLHAWYPDPRCILTAINEAGVNTPERTAAWLLKFITRAAELGHRTIAYNSYYQSPPPDYWKTQHAVLDLLRDTEGMVGAHKGATPFLSASEALLEDFPRLLPVIQRGIKFVITELVGSQAPDRGWQFFYPTAAAALKDMRLWAEWIADHGGYATLYSFYKWASGKGFELDGSDQKSVDFRAGLIEINHSTPVRTYPVPATLIDMQAHIFPRQSSLYSLIGAGSNETCRTRYLPSGYGYFDKNENFEEGWADEHYVYRGFDISSFRNNEVYGLWTKLADGTLRYGNPWTPRWMSEGQIFKRTAWVIHYDASGNLKAAQQVVTWIKLVKYHATRTFASERVVTGVAELQYGFAPDVSDVREHYFYGLNLGLVGFEDGILTTFIGSGTPTTIKPQTVIPWVNALRPAIPPVQGVPTVPTIPAPTTGGEKAALATIPGEFINARAQPNPASATSNTSADVGDYLVGDEVMWYPNAKQGEWVYVEPFSQVARPVGRQPAAKGWVSLQGGSVKFVPALLPPVEKTITYPEADIEFIRQHMDSINLLLAKGVPSSSGGGF